MRVWQRTFELACSKKLKSNICYPSHCSDRHARLLEELSKMLHYNVVNIKYHLPVSCLVEGYWDGLSLSNSSFVFHSSLLGVICVPLRQYWHFFELEFDPTLGRIPATKANPGYFPLSWRHELSGNELFNQAVPARVIDRFVFTSWI